MDKDLDNANPTILSAAQLPTRQTKRVAPRKGPDAKYNDIILAKPAYLSRPFCDDDSLWPDRDIVDDDFAEEPIDEQEIYGKRGLPHSSCVFLSCHYQFPCVDSWNGSSCRILQM